MTRITDIGMVSVWDSKDIKIQQSNDYWYQYQYYFWYWLDFSDIGIGKNLSLGIGIW